MRLAGQAPFRLRPLSSNVRQQAAAFMVLASVVKDQMHLRAAPLASRPQNGVTSLSSGLARLRSMSPSGASRSASVSVSASAAARCPAVATGGAGASASKSSSAGGKANTRASSRRRFGFLHQVRWHRGHSPRRCLLARCSIRRFLGSGRLLQTHCCLTLRSSGRPPASQLGREASAVYHPPRGQAGSPASAPQLKR